MSMLLMSTIHKVIQVDVRRVLYYQHVVDDSPMKTVLANLRRLTT